jgi:hypothetical protein
MNPVIVIPTYWGDPLAEGTYDHATPVDDPHPDLERCLESLEQVRGVTRTMVLLVASPDVRDRARARVEEICLAHPGLTPMVVGQAEARLVTERVTELAPRLTGECVSLRGYGAIRNMGLAVAATLGHDVVVFLDDDEVALSKDFLVEAVYALGQLTRQNIPVVAKSGYFIDENDSPYAKRADKGWQNRHWTKREEFNAWMKRAQSATRISRSNVCCGGCMALHAMAYTNVAFDPFITRGEDLDYVLNLRFYGLEMWFDNQWFVKHLPPATPDPARRFKQDVYRWFYERAKLGFASSRVNLNQVTAASLMPYPGPWLSDDLDARVARTTLYRSLKGDDKPAYRSLLVRGIPEAKANAEEHAAAYLGFQSYWPHLMQEMWRDKELGDRILSTAVPAGLVREARTPDSYYDSES